MPATPHSAVETIAAVATPRGSGGVAIIRVSGPASRDVLARVFRASRAGFTDFIPHTLHHGSVVRPATPQTDETPLDEALAVFMPGPRSFTGEDVAELHCHGGPAVTAAVLEAVLEAGARAASPGEFTRRAFLSGRLDLTQAEAVGELIAAQSREGLRLAQAKLSGGLGRRIGGLRERLESLRVRLCAAVDFPDEELECLAPDELTRDVGTVMAALDELASAYERAAPWRDGALVVLAGRVNVGKSSLFNALVGRARAIVTDVPGTTRDVVEETLQVGGMPVRLADTAGVREATDRVERVGLEMARELMDGADLVLLVVEARETLSEEERDLMANVGEERLLLVANKADVVGGIAPPAGACLVSARTEEGLPELLQILEERLVTAAPLDAGELAPNLRQRQGLERAGVELSALVDDASRGMPYDVLGVRLEAACAELDEIVGRVAPQELLDTVFDRFCIGK